MSIIKPRLSFETTTTNLSTTTVVADTNTPQTESSGGSGGPMRSRKRAIRGGGPLGDDEVVIFRNSPSATPQGYLFYFNKKIVAARNSMDSPTQFRCDCPVNGHSTP